MFSKSFASEMIYTFFLRSKLNFTSLIVLFVSNFANYNRNWRMNKYVRKNVLNNFRQPRLCSAHSLVRTLNFFSLEYKKYILRINYTNNTEICLDLKKPHRRSWKFGSTKTKPMTLHWPRPIAMVLRNGSPQI